MNTISSANNTNIKQKAIIVGILNKNKRDSSDEVNYSLEELTLLLKTLGIETKEKYIYIKLRD